MKNSRIIEIEARHCSVCRKDFSSYKVDGRYNSPYSILDKNKCPDCFVSLELFGKSICRDCGDYMKWDYDPIYCLCEKCHAGLRCYFCKKTETDGAHEEFYGTYGIGGTEKVCACIECIDAIRKFQS